MPKLIYASTKNRDLFYAIKQEIGDPVFFIDAGEKKYLFLDYRDLEAFKEKNKIAGLEVLNIKSFYKEAVKIEAGTHLTDKLALVLFEKFGIKNEIIDVPIGFPLDMADFLRSKGIMIVPQHNFFPERAIKNEGEKEIMKNNLAKTVLIFKIIEDVLTESVIDGKYLKYRNEILTSEILKKIAEIEMINQDFIDIEDMIISSGKQSAIPHHKGEGPLFAHQPIICDLFPCDKKTGYFSDMTRTYVKGKADEKLKKMYEAVLGAQEKAISLVKAGIEGREIHLAVVDYFNDKGFREEEGRGFVHGTGHGLGLDVHEAPSVGPFTATKLQAGNIITIEPGLYYPELGGVRLEDVVYVTKEGCENLTDHEKVLEIE